MIQYRKSGLVKKQLQALQTQILAMANLTGATLVRTTNSLHQDDVEDTQKLISAGQSMNDMRYIVTTNSLALMATEHLGTNDRRLISAFIEIAAELERMHGYAIGIAKIRLLIDKESHSMIPTCLLAMAAQVHQILHRAVDALIQRDANLARYVAAQDGEMDALYEKTYLDLIRSEPKSLQREDHIHRLLWVAHNLKRAGGRVTNICDWVTYVVTGQRMELNAKIVASPVLQPTSLIAA